MIHDLRYGWRRVAGAPRFSAVVVLTLSLGIGAATTVFSLVRAILVEPLPYPESGRLVSIIETISPTDNPAGVAEERITIAAHTLRPWRALTTTLTEIAGYLTSSATIITPDGATRVPVARVSPALFSALGARMQLGRAPLEAESQPHPREAVLSAEAWSAYFGRRPDVIGRTISLDGVSHTVVGVTASGFNFPSQEIQLWIPLGVDAHGSVDARSVNVVARVKPRVSLGEASADADFVGRRLSSEPERPGPAPRFRVEPLLRQMTAGIAPALHAFTALAAVILCIMTANVLTLLLSRGTRHRQEAVIQRALGASRVRIATQIMAEAFLLGMSGAGIGVALSFGSVELLKRLARVDVPELFQLASRQQFGSGSVFPRLEGVAVDATGVTFAIGVASLACVLGGLGPVAQIAADERRSFTDDTSRPSAISLKGARLRSLLVVAQIAAATSFLVAAVVLVRSFAQLSRVPMGYDPSSVLSFQLVLPSEYPTARKEWLAHEFAARVRALPGVEAAGFASLPPLAGGAFAYGVFLPPQRTLPEMMRDPAAPQARCVSEGYLPAMGVRLLEGRWFEAGDGADAMPVLLVTRSLARRYFGPHSPVGVTVQLAPSRKRWTIVGMVDDIHNGSPWEMSYPQFFMDARQALRALPDLPERMRETAALGFLSYAVRLNRDPAAILADLRSSVHRLDASAALDGMMPLGDIVFAGMARPRLHAIWSGLFAFVAAVLGLTGVYATVAYATLKRTREIGIRLALGAPRSTVLRLVLSHGLALATTGVVLGLFLAHGLSSYLATLLLGTANVDLQALGLVGALFFVMTAAASLLPALRASRIDPMSAIRCE